MVIKVSARTKCTGSSSYLNSEKIKYTFLDIHTYIYSQQTSAVEAETIMDHWSVNILIQLYAIIILPLIVERDMQTVIPILRMSSLIALHTI